MVVAASNTDVCLRLFQGRKAGGPSVKNARFVSAFSLDYNHSDVSAKSFKSVKKQKTNYWRFLWGVNSQQLNMQA